MHFILGEELLKLREQLCRQGLVVSQHQGSLAGILDQVCHSKGLARAGHAQQSLILLALFYPLGQTSNRPRLITGRLILSL